LEGGILVALGKLFSDDTNVFVYPAEIDGKLVTLENVDVPEKVRHLVRYLVSNRAMIEIEDYNEANLHISPKVIAGRIQEGRGDWENCVPEGIAEEIVKKRLFGFPG
jgi:hypothetical protein